MWFGTMSTISPRLGRAQRGDQASQRSFATKLGIDACWVDHVIAMHRTRPRGGDRRGIDVADAKPREIRNQRLGIRKGETLVELQPHRGARCHLRSRNVFKRARTFGAWSMVDAGSASRRRQFGCSSIVPGRLGCSDNPRMSSIGMSASGAGDCAVNAIAASTAGSAAAGGGSSLCATPECWKACHIAVRSFARSIVSFALSARPIAARIAMSAPVHHPATVGRSCVVVIATASGRHLRGGRKDRPSRWNQSTSIPAMPAADRRSRNSGCTVPRSSPTTIALCRCDSSAIRRSSRRADRQGRRRLLGGAPLGTSHKRASPIT